MCGATNCAFWSPSNTRLAPLGLLIFLYATLPLYTICLAFGMMLRRTLAKLPPLALKHFLTYNLFTGASGAILTIIYLASSTMKCVEYHYPTDTMDTCWAINNSQVSRHEYSANKGVGRCTRRALTGLTCARAR